MGTIRVAAVTAAVALLCAGCPLRPLTGNRPPGPAGPGTPVAQTPPNTAPRLTGEVVVSASPGRPTMVTLPIRDDDGDAVAVSVAGRDGLSAVRGTGDTWRLRWSPIDTGTVIATLTLTDERGARRVERVTLRSTNPGREDTLLALGDSVASGHGLQKRDYLRRDGCWRSEHEAYGWHVYQGLVARGDFGGEGDYALVACSGSTLRDLLDEPVGGGPADTAPRGSTKLSQVDWAIAANPQMITLTAGANTLGFTDPWNLLDPDMEVDLGELERRLGRVDDDLDEVLRRLVRHSDSLVFVTNYYNPAANEPQGVDGCRADCFRQRTEKVVGAFNDTIAAVVMRFPADRVVLVDLHGVFEGHGAPNGLGPDGLRAGASGWIRDMIGAPLEGVHPYCARGHDDDGSWVNYVDCVHPDGRGHREIAAAILAEAVLS